MLLLYHSHKHISYPIRTIARSAIEAVKLVKETGQASTKIAKDLGIDGSMLSKKI